MAAGATSTPSQNKTVSGAAYSVFAAAKRCIGYKSECDQRYLSSLKELVPIILFLLFAAFLILAVAMYLSNCSSLEPKPPRFIVDSASFSKLNFSSSNLTANGLISLRVINVNPNYSISYDKLHAVLFYGSESKQPFDVARAPPFYQYRLGESVIKFQFELVNEYVGEAVARSRIRDAGARGYVDFGVWVKAWIDYEPEEKEEEQQKQKLCWFSSISSSNLDIRCNPVTFGLWSHDGTGSMMIPSRKCEVIEDQRCCVNNEQ